MSVVATIMFVLGTGKRGAFRLATQLRTGKAMDHKVICLNFTSLVSESWDSLPDIEKIKRQVAIAALAHSELNGVPLGLYAPPKEVREVQITVAAADQIRCMWHGHRRRGQIAPPAIPLKIFVFGTGQDSNGTWASIEVHPGVDEWEAL